jgi:hypothetical protein
VAASDDPARPLSFPCGILSVEWWGRCSSQAGTGPSYLCHDRLRLQGDCRAAGGWGGLADQPAVTVSERDPGDPAMAAGDLSVLARRHADEHLGALARFLTGWQARLRIPCSLRNLYRCRPSCNPPTALMTNLELALGEKEPARQQIHRPKARSSA